MTIDRAIQILDPDHREHYDGLAEVNEACRMGMAALQERRERENPAPLTLEELRRMDGEPVYIIDLEPLEFGWKNRWFLVDADEDVVYNDGYQFEIPQCVGFAYRSKPEQEG